MLIKSLRICTFYYWIESKGLQKELRNPTSQPLISNDADDDGECAGLLSVEWKATKRNELNKHYHPPVGDYI